MKYIPVLKQYCSFADVSAGNVDPRIAKMIEVISNDIQSGNATVENNKVAKMVRFLADPEYAELLDMEALTDMVMADPQAFMVMTQMTNMQMAKSIMATQGAIPLSVNTTVAPQEKTESDDSMKLEGEDDARYKERMTRLMEEAAKYGNYEAAARYQKALNSI